MTGGMDNKAAAYARLTAAGDRAHAAARDTLATHVDAAGTVLDSTGDEARALALMFTHYQSQQHQGATEVMFVAALLRLAAVERWYRRWTGWIHTPVRRWLHLPDRIVPAPPSKGHPA